MWSGWPVDFEFSLAADFINWRLVSQLRYELVSLDVNVLLAWWSLWGLDISCEEFFGSLGPLLF